MDRWMSSLRWWLSQRTVFFLETFSWNDLVWVSFICFQRLNNITSNQKKNGRIHFIECRCNINFILRLMAYNDLCDFFREPYHFRATIQFYCEWSWRRRRKNQLNRMIKEKCWQKIALISFYFIANAKMKSIVKIFLTQSLLLFHLQKKWFGCWYQMPSKCVLHTQYTLQSAMLKTINSHSLCKT